MLTTSCKSARRCSAFSALALFSATLAVSAQQPPKSADNSRLIDTAKVWIAVKYFHPYLAYKPIDWDRALVNALPAIRAAKTGEEYATALQSMLDVLHDPLTRVDRKGDAGPPVTAAPVRNRIWIHHGFPPESGGNGTPFYTAFECCQTGTDERVTIPVSD